MAAHETFRKKSYWLSTQENWNYGPKSEHFSPPIGCWFTHTGTTCHFGFNWFRFVSVSHPDTYQFCFCVWWFGQTGFGCQNFCRFGPNRPFFGKQWNISPECAMLAYKCHTWLESCWKCGFLGKKSFGSTLILWAQGISLTLDPEPDPLAYTAS